MPVGDCGWPAGRSGESSGSAGGYLVPSPLSAELIDRLRAASTILRAGTLTVPFDSQTLSMARVLTDPVIVSHAENAADLEQNGPTLELIFLHARSLGCVVRASRELVEDSTAGGGLNEVLTSLFAKAMASEIDRQCLLSNGSGGTSITGLLNIAGVSKTAFNASVTDYTPILNGVSALLNANNAFPTAAIMSVRSYMQFAGLQNTLHDALRKPSILDALPFLPTSKIPTNDLVAAATNGSVVYSGDFSQAMLGVRTDLIVEVLKERYADSGQYGFTCWWRGDFKVRHQESFNIQQGLQP